MSLNVRWANTFVVPNQVGEFLIQKQKSGEPINLTNMVGENPRQELVSLVFKEAIVPKDEKLRAMLDKGEVKVGCSVNPEDIPDPSLLV